MAGFLDQGAVEGVQAGWLLNFVIFGRNGALLGPLGLPAPPRPGGAPAPGGWIPGPGGHRGSPGRLVAQFRDFWASRPIRATGPPAPGGWIPGPGGRRGRPGRLVAQFRDFWGCYHSQVNVQGGRTGQEALARTGSRRFPTSIMLSSLKTAGRWQIETRGPLRQRGRSVQDLVFRGVRTGQEASARAGSRLPPGVFRTSIDAFEPQEGWTIYCSGRSEQDKNPRPEQGRGYHQAFFEPQYILSSLKWAGR